MDDNMKWEWFDAGAKQERERIIELLKQLSESEYSEVMTYDDLINLIMDK